MKKLINQSLILVCLLILSVSAFLYVNVSTIESVSDKDNVRLEEQRMEESAEEDITFMEVEFLKRLIRQGASRIPFSNI
jgi:hypothetical protein